MALPGARRQIPESARVFAEKCDICLIGIDRPGVGSSTPHMYDEIIDFTTDLEVLLDRLGVDKFAVIGLSGGGPYTLATAAAMPDRVQAVGPSGAVLHGCQDVAQPGGLQEVIGPGEPAAQLGLF